MKTFNFKLELCFKAWMLIIWMASPTLVFCNQEGLFTASFQTLFINVPSVEFTYLSDGKIKPLPVGLDLLSQSVNFVGDTPLILIFSGQPDTKKNLLEQAIASIPLDEHTGKFTLICLALNEALNCVKIETSIDAFPLGAFCFVNATTNSVVGLLGDERMAIQPGGNFILNIDNFDMRRVPIKMAYMDEGDDWQMFYSSKWTVQRHTRSFIIIYRDQRNGKLIARGVDFKH